MFRLLFCCCCRRHPFERAAHQAAFTDTIVMATVDECKPAAPGQATEMTEVAAKTM